MRSVDVTDAAGAYLNAAASSFCCLFIPARHPPSYCCTYLANAAMLSSNNYTHISPMMISNALSKNFVL